MKNNSIKVAILLAAYNGNKWISEQLDSIFNQKKVQIDIYVSLDISTDKTMEVLESTRNTNNNLHILPYGQKFGGAAKNFYRLIKDVDFSNYDYVAYADQDDIWSDDKLYHGIKTMKINNAKAYSSDVIAFWPDGRKKLIKKSYPQRRYDFIFESAGPGCTYIFKTTNLLIFKNFLLSNWKEISTVDYHDWLSYSFFRANGFKWLIDNKPKMLYRQHENNQLGANFSLKGYLSRFRLIINGWYFKQIKLITTILKLPRISKRFILINLLETRRRKIDLFYILFITIFFKK